MTCAECGAKGKSHEPRGMLLGSVPVYVCHSLPPGHIAVCGRSGRWHYALLPATHTSERLVGDLAALKVHRPQF